MKSNNFFAAAIAAILCVSFVSGQTVVNPGGTINPTRNPNLPPGPGDITNISFNKQAFEASLTNALAPNVMGYQYVLIKGGSVVSQDADGWAQAPGDGNVAMTTSTPTNIGSVAKFLSGTAMIHLMENLNGPGAYDAGQTLQQKLDRPFTTIVPDVWIDGNTPGVASVTLRQLLQHRSGFNDNKPANRNVLGFLKDGDGHFPWQLDQRQYSNINFVLNGYLIPLYEKPWMKGFINTSVNDLGYGIAEADEATRDLTGAEMHKSMKARIWDKMTPKILPNCDAANTLADTAAKHYASSTDTDPGEITSQIVNKGHCSGEGGYYMSALDLANYLAHFSSTDLIVTNTGRNAMFNDAMNPNDRLVWGSSTASNYMATNFNMPNVVWSNGIAGGYRAAIIRFPMNYYLVVLTNSPDLSAGDLFNAGRSAFVAATQHNF